MAVKVYVKRGNLNYKERKYIQEITKALEEKGITGDFEPATNFDDLKRLYDEYCSQDAQIISETKNPKPTTKEPIKETTTKEVEETLIDDSDFVDPFNSGEVIVRDYVVDDSMKKKAADSKSSFDEPSADMKFELPDDSDDENGEEKSTKSSGGGASSSGEKSTKKEKSAPINPSFDEMPNSAKKKSTKRLAKAIVFATCKLAEFGCVWYVTKDITPDKVAEYDLQKSMDLDLLLSLDDNQQITVRDWFALQVKNSNDLLKVSEEGKEEMADALYVVLMEKGVALTPTQEAILSFGVHVILDLGVKAYAMQQQIKSVLNQLKMMRKDELERAKQEQEEQEQEEKEQETELKEDFDTNFEDDGFDDDKIDNQLAKVE